jgi:hypothetical protein
MPQQKITLGEMRSSGVRGLLVYCADYKCSHSIKLEGAVVDRWADGVRISDIEPRLVCKRCGARGADIRPNFAPARMGTRAAVRKLLPWISEG